MSAEPRRQIRDALRAFVPPWASDKGAGSKSVGFKLLWAIAAVLDGLLEGLVQGIVAAFPGLGTPTALPMIGRMRQIRRGLAETNAAYTERLRAWRTAHKHAGHPFEILRQIRAYLGPVKCRTVDFSGNWHTIEEDGTETWLQAPFSWNWHSEWALGWGMLWVIVYAPSNWQTWPAFYEIAPSLYGGNLAGNGWTRGQQVTFNLAEDIRQIVKTWKPLHARVVKIIVAFDPASFDPSEPSTLPDGNWLYYAKGTPKVPARIETARYWEGVE